MTNAYRGDKMERCDPSKCGLKPSTCGYFDDDFCTRSGKLELVSRALSVERVGEEGHERKPKRAVRKEKDDGGRGK